MLDLPWNGFNDCGLKNGEHMWLQQYFFLIDFQNANTFVLKVFEEVRSSIRSKVSLTLLVDSRLKAAMIDLHFGSAVSYLEIIIKWTTTILQNLGVDYS